LNLVSLGFDTLFGGTNNTPAASTNTAGVFPIFSGEQGFSITEETSLKISHIWCAINDISNTFSLLPKSVYLTTEQNGKKIKTRAKSHAIDYLIHNEPNNKMTAATFDQIMVVSYFLRGNAFARIERNQAGQVSALHFLHPDNVRVVEYDGSLYYVLMATAGDPTVLDSSEVLHVPAFSFNGIVGRSIIQFAADNIGIAAGAQKFQTDSFSDKGLTHGVLETDKAVNKDAKVAIQNAYSSAMQNGNKYRVAVLDEGMKHRSINLTADQVKVLDTMQFSVADTARWFNVPLNRLKVKGEGGYNFMVEMKIEYIQTAIMPLANKFKQEYDRKLFTDNERAQGYKSHFHFKSLLQADPKGRAQYYKDLINIKAITPNEVRILEGLNPFEQGGDEPLQAVNMITDSQRIENTKNSNNE